MDKKIDKQQLRREARRRWTIGGGIAIVAVTVVAAALGMGGTFNMDYVPYRVIGVVRDTSPHATMAHADVFVPSGTADTGGQWNEYLGEFGVYMLLAPDTDIENVRNRVRSAYARLSTELGPESLEAVYHLAPLTAYEMNSDIGGSNNDPDLSMKRGINYSIYLLLLLIPAINLGSMLHSRMRRRVSEFGVRRAYGCTHGRIIADIVYENLILTAVGALLGFAAAIVVGKTCAPLFGEQFALSSEAPPIQALLSWQTVCFAVVATLLLNLLSAIVPAWKASRLSVVEAIKG